MFLAADGYRYNVQMDLQEHEAADPQKWSIQLWDTHQDEEVMVTHRLMQWQVADGTCAPWPPPRMCILLFCLLLPASRVAPLVVALHFTARLRVRPPLSNFVCTTCLTRSLNYKLVRVQHTDDLCSTPMSGEGASSPRITSKTILHARR